MHEDVRKINWKLNKKREERMFSDFFVERFNKNYNLNYRTISNSEEANEVDFYAVSEDGETLNLQLKTGEPESEKFYGTRIKQGSGMAIIDTEIKELLSQIIKAGELHYANAKNLILLITAKEQYVFDEDYALCISNKFKAATFKGIYLVKLPAFDKKHPYEGQIVAIKDIFGKHGKTF